MYCVYLLCIYKYTHLHVYIEEKYVTFIYKTFIYDIIWMNINICMEIHVNMFEKYAVCVFLSFSIYIYIYTTPYIYIYILGVARHMYSYRTNTVRTSRFGPWGLTMNKVNSPPILKGAPAVMQHVIMFVTFCNNFEC